MSNVEGRISKFDIRCSTLDIRCRSWRRPTLPRPRDRSTIGADRLNDRVRDGNGCGPVALVASTTAAIGAWPLANGQQLSGCCGIEDHAEQREEIKPHGQLVRLG